MTRLPDWVDKPGKISSPGQVCMAAISDLIFGWIPPPPWSHAPNRIVIAPDHGQFFLVPQWPDPLGSSACPRNLQLVSLMPLTRLFIMAMFTPSSSFFMTMRTMRT